MGRRALRHSWREERIHPVDHAVRTAVQSEIARSWCDDPAIRRSDVTSRLLVH
jgi:hypothetical protein